MSLVHATPELMHALLIFMGVVVGGIGLVGLAALLVGPNYKRATTRRKAVAVAVAVVALAAAAFALIPSTALAADRSPWAATDIALRSGGGAPASTTLECVAPSRMIAEGGSHNTLGLTYYATNRVLILNSLCSEVGRWYWTAADNLRYGTVDALQTVMHEAEHTRGIRVEWQAECVAVPKTLAYLRRYHATADQIRIARNYLYHGAEKYRPAAYKLRGRCV